jgi:ATP-independent RNA helicase DbpA
LAELTPASSAPLQPPRLTLHIAGGRKDKIRPGDVLGALTGEVGLQPEQVGKIHVNEFATYVAVDRQVAEQAVRGLSQGRVKGKSVKVRLLQGDASD